MDDAQKTRTQLISELAELRQKVATSEDRFRAAQDISLEAFTILRSIRDDQGKIIDFEWTYANRVAGEILKHPPEKLVGQRLLDILPGNLENRALFERYARIAETGQGDEVELRYRSEVIDGWFRNMAVKLGDGVAVSFSDITRRKRAEAILLRDKEELERLVEERTAEVATANAQLHQVVVEYQQTEALLRENEQTLHQLKKAIETTGIGITIADTMGKIIYTNPADAQMHGYAVNELIGRPAHIFATPELRQPAPPLRDDETIFQDWRRERPNMRRDGSVFPAKLTSNPIYDTHKFRIGTVTVCEDITEQKQMEQALRESEGRFRLIAETIQEVFWMADITFEHIFYISPSYEQIWGRSCQSLYDNPQSFIDAVHPEDRIRVFDNWAAENIGQAFEHEYRILLPDGSTRWISDRGFPIREDTGQIIRYVGVARDITDSKRAEEALRENELIFSSFLEHSPVYVFFKDKEIRSLRLSKNYELMLGMPISRVLGKSMDELFPSDLARKMIADDRKILEKRDVVNVVEELDGRTYETTKFPIFKDGNPYMLAGFTLDITERKRAEEELQRAKDALETANAQLQELNASKDKFFSIIAHDLKNPLNAFLSFADILEQLDEYAPERRQTLIQQFRTTAERLFALLDNLLTWARSQQGRIPYTPHTLPLATLAAHVIELVQPHAADKQIRLIDTVPRDLSVFADLSMLETVIRNLLTNAIKFTPTGGNVTISAQQTDHEIELSVSDTGIGMTEDTVSCLFRLGAKIKQTGTAGEKGTGLGLILCNEFVKRHGGTIRCESVIDQGSVFRFTLPTTTMTHEQE